MNNSDISKATFLHSLGISTWDHAHSSFAIIAVRSATLLAIADQNLAIFILIYSQWLIFANFVEIFDAALTKYWGIYSAWSMDRGTS